MDAAEYFQARDWGAVSGRLLTPEDVDTASKMVVQALRYE